MDKSQEVKLDEFGRNRERVGDWIEKLKDEAYDLYGKITYEKTIESRKDLDLTPVEIEDLKESARKAQDELTARIIDPIRIALEKSQKETELLAKTHETMLFHSKEANEV
jgi:hypothetical protein